MNRAFSAMNGGLAARRGFTVVELLVTMAIITIIVSIGVPMYGSFTRDSALSSAASSLSGAIQEARSRAVSERTTIQLVRLGAGPLGDWSQGWQIVRLSDAQVLQVVELQGDGVSVIELNGIGETRFDREGRAAPAVTFQMYPQGVEPADPGREIDVGRFGRVQIRKVYHP